MPEDAQTRASARDAQATPRWATLPQSAQQAFIRSVEANPELNADTRELYAHIWAVWVEWLATRSKCWSNANAEDVAAFLAGSAPGQRRRREPKDPTRMKAFTKQRYWRVLTEVYRSHHVNPAFEYAQDSGGPGVPRKDRVAEVLAPGVLQKLQDASWLRECIPAAEGRHEWLALRDRALLALVAHCALTTGELQALSPADLTAGKMRTLLSVPQHDLPGIKGAGEAHVHVPATRTLGRRGTLAGERPDEKLEIGNREVPIPTGALELVWDWLLAWKTLEQPTTGPLFPSARPSAGAQTLGPLTPAMIFMIVRDCVRMASGKPWRKHSASRPAPNEGSNAQGPAVVRNTVLQQWLLTLDKNEVARRAGLKDASSLRIPPLKPA